MFSCTVSSLINLQLIRGSAHGDEFNNRMIEEERSIQLLEQHSAVELLHRQFKVTDRTLEAPLTPAFGYTRNTSKSNPAVIKDLSINTRRLRHTNPNSSCSPSIDRQYSTSDEPRMIARQENHSRRTVPPIAFSAEQAPRLPRRSRLIRHASSIHHGSVQHLRKKIKSDNRPSKPETHSSDLRQDRRN